MANVADFAKADIARGARIFKLKCAKCHTINKDGINMNGPNLYGFFGRQSGLANAYPYSTANKSAGMANYSII